MADTSWMNTAVPIILVIIFVAFIYSKFKEPLQDFWQWVSGLFKSGAAKAGDNVETMESLVYK